jgi:AcrR family transcriptional regulator
MPNRAGELMWDDEPGADEPRGLTRAAVVRAAIGLADSEGLEAVSIRRVAAKLSARPMSLYTHIASKEDLLGLMVNEVVAEVLLPEPLPDDWREALRQIARVSHDVFVAHPWTLAAFGGGAPPGPNIQRHGEQSAAAIAGLGLDEQDTWTVLGVVDEYTIGHAMRVLHLGDHDPDPRADSFDLGLEVVLDGIEKRFVSR